MRSACSLGHKHLPHPFQTNLSPHIRSCPAHLPLNRLPVPMEHGSITPRLATHLSHSTPTFPICNHHHQSGPHSSRYQYRHGRRMVGRCRMTGGEAAFRHARRHRCHPPPPRSRRLGPRPACRRCNSHHCPPSTKATTLRQSLQEDFRNHHRLCMLANVSVGIICINIMSSFASWTIRICFVSSSMSFALLTSELELSPLNRGACSLCAAPR